MNKYLLIVLITLLYYSCEDSSNIISFDEIKNELEHKRLTDVHTLQQRKDL